MNSILQSFSQQRYCHSIQALFSRPLGCLLLAVYANYDYRSQLERMNTILRDERQVIYITICRSYCSTF